MPRPYYGLLLSLLLDILLTYELFGRKTKSWSKRDIFLFSVILWGTTVFLITEGLSLFQQFKRTPLTIAWIVILVIQVAIYIFLIVRRRGFTLQNIWSRITDSLHFSHLSSWVIICLFIISFQLITLNWVAYFYPPTNWDSMTYHLPRIMHWEQNGSVAFYTTSIERQNEYQPFAEYILAHLNMLANKDRWLNMLQLYALAISAVGVSSIAKKLGAGVIQQWISALLCISIPMAVLQATSTQNDLVVSALLVIFINFGLKMVLESADLSTAVGCGLGLGLAILCKATAYLYAFPFVLLFGGWLLIKNWRKSILLGGLIGLIVILLNVGFYSRNLSLYGSVLGSSENMKMANNRLITLQTVSANTIRNIALNVPITTGVPFIDDFSRGFMDWLRLFYETTSLKPTDPSITWSNVDAFTMDYRVSEDFSGNPIHLLLIVITLIVAIFTIRRSDRRKISLIYIVPLVTGFIIFSGFLKWQQWATRLQLPLFILWCAVIPVFLFTTKNKFLLALPLFIGAFALTWTFNNGTRPINQDAIYSLPRDENYFRSNSSLKKPYLQLIDQIIVSKCTEIGLVLGADTYEYPLWAILEEREFPARIEHIFVKTQSRTYEDVNFKPCAIVHFNSKNNSLETTHDVFEFKPFMLYIEKK